MKISILAFTAVTAQRGVRTTITNVSDMADQMLNGVFSASDANNYGCTGRGQFSPFDPTVGKPVDEADSAFFKWKKCIQCVNNNKDLGKVIPAYNYDKTIDSCGMLTNKPDFTSQNLR